MKYLFFFFFSVTIYAQNIVSGNILSENGYVIQNVKIVNISSGDKTSDNTEGFFKIKANINDELRFIKDNFERRSIIIQNNDFLTPLSIQLVRIPIEIEEVKVTIKPTGNLEKDAENHNPSKKVLALNNDIREYVKKPMTKIYPKNNIPSSFAPRDPYAEQLKLLSITIGDTSGEIIGSPAKEFFKKNKPKLSFSEIQNFHKKVKNFFYGDYYIKRGLNDSDFDEYILYLDKKYKFSENYSGNFDSSKIEQVLKISLNEFIK